GITEPGQVVEHDAESLEEERLSADCPPDLVEDGGVGEDGRNQEPLVLLAVAGTFGVGSDDRELSSPGWRGAHRTRLPLWRGSIPRPSSSTVRGRMARQSPLRRAWANSAKMRVSGASSCPFDWTGGRSGRTIPIGRGLPFRHST